MTEQFWFGMMVGGALVAIIVWVVSGIQMERYLARHERPKIRRIRR